MVAKATDIPFFTFNHSLSNSLAKITINGGVEEVIMAPICAEDRLAPTSCITNNRNGITNYPNGYN